MLVSEQTRPNTVRLRMSVVGGFSLERPGGGFLKIVNRKACGLLTYLALGQNQFETRERLAGLLWSDRGEDQARASLRQCLKQLRTVFDECEFGGFRTDRYNVGLAADSLCIDLQEISERLDREEISDQLLNGNILSETILYGYESLDQSFAAWLHVIRKNWHDKLVDKLQSYLATGRGTVTHKAAAALVGIDPTHEEGHRHLIRQYADAGNTAAALKQYKKIWDLLENEFDTEPDEATQSLIADVKAGTYLPASQPMPFSLRPTFHSPAIATTRPHTLPILEIWQFVQGGPWNQERYLIEGFRREMIASLIRFREWIVVEGTPTLNPSNFEFERRSPADYQLEGTYLEDAGKIRLIITLKEFSSQQYIWSEQISLTLENWFDAQQEIVRRVSIALNVYLSVERVSKISDSTGIPLDAYDDWLRGQELTLKWRPDAHHEAQQIFHRIIGNVPGFGRALSSLVQIANAEPLVHPGIHRSTEKTQEVVRMAREAVLVDPLDSRAQLCLGWASAINGQFENAQINLDLACELNKNDPWTLVSSALAWAFCDRTDEAIRLSQQALSLGISPSKSHWGYQATLQFICGDYQACVDAANLADEALINLPAWKAAALHHLGRQTEAEKAAEQFLHLVRQHWVKPGQPDDRDISGWLLQCFPIRSKPALERLRAGLKGAGIRFYT